ncbi:hypothetical protein E2P81_ATG09865 [Venturia nashicola]|uniref:Uncharacterized protein n=1 Tax=Venturia nashicola TaxID=86259 RepID=A0A4Z1NR37_9PEZI|nr:hypothetical protein E6O75_ATG10082 [Venturia nashicola]TLD15017.1 hypothetical protein E2P81_ATG09865 [Venturia nashicola]
MTDTGLTQGQRLFLVALLYCFVHYFEPTLLFDLLQPLLALYYACAALPKDCNTRALIDLIHLVFAATHTLKVLVYIDKAYWHDHQILLQPTVPLTELAKENLIVFRLVDSASICYIVFKILNLLFSEVSQPQDNTPTSNATVSAKTHTISISTQTNDWYTPVHEAPIHVLQASPQPKMDLKQEKSGHCISTSKGLLTQEQVDVILAHAKEEQDSNAEQQRSMLKRQFKQSEDRLQQWRSAHVESLHKMASLEKTIKEAAQKISDHKTLYHRQTMNSQKHFEKAACQAKRRAETAERQLSNVKDEFDDREQTIQSLRVLLREKRVSAKSQPFVYVAQDDKVDVEVESLRKQLKDTNSKNQALSHEIEIAKSAPSTRLTKTEEELAAVKASSAAIEAELDDKTKAYTELESRLNQELAEDVTITTLQNGFEAAEIESKRKDDDLNILQNGLEAAKIASKRKDDELNILQAQLKTTKEESEMKDSTINILQAQVHEKDTTIGIVLSESQIQDMTIHELQSKISIADARVQKLGISVSTSHQAAILAKDQEIHHLNTALATRNLGFNELAAQNADYATNYISIAAANEAWAIKEAGLQENFGVVEDSLRDVCSRKVSDRDDKMAEIKKELNDTRTGLTKTKRSRTEANDKLLKMEKEVDTLQEKSEQLQASADFNKCQFGTKVAEVENLTKEAESAEAIIANNTEALDDFEALVQVLGFRLGEVMPKWKNARKNGTEEAFCAEIQVADRFQFPIRFAALVALNMKFPEATVTVLVQGGKAATWWRGDNAHNPKAERCLLRRRW